MATTLTYYSGAPDFLTTSMPYQWSTDCKATLEVDGVIVWRGKPGDLMPPDVEAQIEAIRRAPRGIAWPRPEPTAMTEE